MSRGLNWLIAVGILVILSANAFIYAPVIQKLGLAGTLAAVTDQLTFQNSNNGLENQEARIHFLCSEVQRGEARVWPQVGLWATNFNRELPSLSDVRSAERVLKNASRISDGSDFGKLIDARLDALSPFAEAGFGPAGEDVADAFGRIQELNAQLEENCPVVPDVRSYKGFIVEPDGRFPGLVMSANFSQFGGDATPACWVKLPTEGAHSETVLTLRTAVSSANSNLEDTLKIPLEEINPGRERTTELGWLGLVEDGARTDKTSLVFFDFREPSLFEEPTVFSCEATYAGPDASLWEKSEVYVWEPQR